MRNTFTKLRSQKREIEKKLNITNKIICMQIDENKKLNDNLENQIIKTTRVQDELVLEKKINRRLQLRFITVKQTKDKFYKSFINEVSKRNERESKLNTTIAIMATVITVLIFLLIKGN